MRAAIDFPRPMGAPCTDYRAEITDEGREALRYTQQAIRETIGAATVAVESPTIAELAARTPMIVSLAARPHGDWAWLALFQELYSVEVVRLDMPNGRTWLAACRGFDGRDLSEYGATRMDALRHVWEALLETIPTDGRAA